MKSKRDIEKYLSKYYEYLGKADTELGKIIDEIRKHSQIFPDDFVHNEFAGDGLGIYPEHMNDSNTYVSILDIVNAIKNGEVLNEKWYENNKVL